MLNLSKIQLAKLVLHSMNISTVLLEACLVPKEAEPEEELPPQDECRELEIDYCDGAPGKEEFGAGNPLLDGLCGKWVSKNKKSPYMHIFEASYGYVIVYGQTNERKKQFPDLFDLYAEKDYTYFNTHHETVYLSHNENTDVLTLSPGGEYTRVAELNK